MVVPLDGPQTCLGVKSGKTRGVRNLGTRGFTVDDIGVVVPSGLREHVGIISPV